MKQAWDKFGRQIIPGDLLRTPHFRDSRRRQHYLYHIACENKATDSLEAVPYTEFALGPDGGRIWLRGVYESMEIVAGRMVDGRLFNERKRINVTKFEPQS